MAVEWSLAGINCSWHVGVLRGPGNGASKYERTATGAETIAEHAHRRPGNRPTGTTQPFLFETVFTRDPAAPGGCALQYRHLIGHNLFEVGMV